MAPVDATAPLERRLFWLGRLRAPPQSRDRPAIGSRPAGDAAPGSQPPCHQAEPLTQRELDLLRLLGAGATNREIAERLGLTDGTVKNYVSTLLGKTGLHDRTQLAVWAIRQGLT